MPLEILNYGWARGAAGSSAWKNGPEGGALTPFQSSSQDSASVISKNYVDPKESDSSGSSPWVGVRLD